MVPAWSLVLAFVVGLAIGYVVCRLTMSRGSSTAEALPPATSTEPEPLAPSATPEPVAEAPVEAPAAEVSAAEAPAAEPAPEAPEAEAPAEEPAPEEPAEVAAEIPASAVDDVVAELERRVKGRQTDGEADRTTGRRRK